MDTTANKQLLQDIFAGLARCDARLFVASMADDFRWTIQGNTAWSRTYAGRQSVLDELFTPLRAALGDRIRTVAHRFLADGEHVVVLARGDNRTRSGAAYCNDYCYVFRLAGGKLAELTEYLDTQLVADVLGDPASPPD